MVSVTLSCIGIVIIILSLFFIYKVSQEEKEIYKEIRFIYNNIKDYSLAIDNTFDSLYELIQINLKEIDNININNNINDKDDSCNINKNNQDDKIFAVNHKENKDSNQILYNQIRSLKEIGLSNREIAKKLNKGVREVEIIIKMWSNINI